MATALITGASQGIGACIAERLAKDGYNIAINHYPSDGDKANAEKVAETCRSYGVEVALFPANVAIIHSVKEWSRLSRSSSAALTLWSITLALRKTACCSGCPKNNMMLSSLSTRRVCST